MKVISVNVACVGPLFIEQHGTTHRIVSGIRKQAVAGSVAVGKLGLDGDEQADLTVHGGLSKAVYAYPGEHYAFWEEERRAVFKRHEPLPPGAMGENLTLAGLLETEVWIGDQLRIGSVLLEVSEPRQPCYKFNARMGFVHAAKRMLQSGHTGFYMRVLETGSLQAGDVIVLIPGPRKISLDSLNERRRKGRQRDLF